jgi:hypothetical protein
MGLALTHGIRMMPDGWTIGGATVIVGSTVYIAQREARLMRAGDFNAVKAEAIAAEGRGRDVAIQHGPLECACILEQNAYYRHSVLASRFIKALGNAARDSQQLDAMIQLAYVQTPTRY